jgi:hypothetical protein
LATFRASFCLNFYYILTLIGGLKLWFDEGILRFQKFFAVDGLDFQIEL